MWRIWFGILIGFFAGAIVGLLLAFVAHRWDEKWKAEFIEERVAHHRAMVAPEEIEVSTPPMSSYALFGVLVGGGFGALIGTVVAGCWVILRAMRQTPP